MEQVLQVIGALLILAGFGLGQFGVLEQRSTPYLLLNFFGGAILAVAAWLGRDWGFLALEGTWAVIALWGLGQRTRERRGGSGAA